MKRWLFYVEAGRNALSPKDEELLNAKDREGTVWKTYEVDAPSEKEAVAYLYAEVPEAEGKLIRARKIEKETNIQKD